MAEDFFDGAELLGFVVDDEIALVTELLDVLAQNADAKRMESANGRAVAVFRRRQLAGRARQQFGDALLHFAGGLVGERDAEDIARRDALFDHVRDAISDDARLAGARAGEDQDRAVRWFRRPAFAAD